MNKMASIKERQHTADHIFCQVIFDDYKAETLGMDTNDERVRISFKCDTNLALAIY